MICPMHHRRRCRPGGFTLIELLTVILIIMILVGMVVAAANWARERATMNRAWGELHQWMNWAEEYRANFGRYPGDGYAGATWSSSDFDGVEVFSFRDIPDLDPWGNPYRFRRYSIPNQEAYRIRIWSYGPDGEDGSDDDLVLQSI